MQKWEYKKMERAIDFSDLDDADYMLLGPGFGPVYKWDDLLSDDNPKKYQDEMRRLRDLGDEGWELVSVLYQTTGKKHTYTYYLKRVRE